VTRPINSILRGRTDITLDTVWHISDYDTMWHTSDFDSDTTGCSDDLDTAGTPVTLIARFVIFIRLISALCLVLTLI
jgi:hypothetical protein